MPSDQRPTIAIAMTHPRRRPGACARLRSPRRVAGVGVPGARPVIVACTLFNIYFLTHT